MPTIVERIMKHSKLAPSGCLEWMRPVTHTGYGQLNVNGFPRQVHRLLYETVKGPVGNLCVLHKCDNRKCVNIDHLFVGTRADNQTDMALKGRSPHGETHSKAKLSNVDVKEIRASKMSQAELARLYQVNQSTISRIKAGLRRTRSAYLYI